MDPSSPRNAILIVTPDAATAAHVETAAAGLSSNVRTAVTAMDALQHVDRRPFDLFVIDASLPDMDGYELCRRLRRPGTMEDAPVLMIIPPDEADAVRHALEVGASDILARPLDPDLTVARLRPYTHCPRDPEGRCHQALILQRTQQAVDHSNIGLVWIDEQGRYRDANPAFLALTGYTEDEMRSMTVFDIDPYWDLKRWRDEAWPEFMAGRMPPAFEAAVLRKDGALIPVLLNARFVDFRGERRVFAFVTDISEQKDAEAALISSEERLRLATRSGGIGVWEYDIQEDVLEWDDLLLEVYGTERKTGSVGIDAWRERVHPDDRDAAVAAFMKAVADPSVGFDIEFRILRDNDGTLRYLRGMAGVIRDGNGTPLRAIGTNWDITEQRQLEAQLNQARQMEAIGTLAGGIAHDFNNILSGIIGFADLAMIEAGKGNNVEEDLQQVIKGGRRAKELVSQILAISHQKKSGRRPVRLQPIIGEAIQLLRASIPATIEFRSNIDDTCEEVVADPTQIHQAIMNLGTNAFHAMRKSGGVLDIRLEPRLVSAKAADAHINLAAGPYVVLTVADTGHGITASDQAHMFEPYFTTKSHGEGTGLGLSLVHSMVKDASGAILVDSVVGRGTRFELFLPTARKHVVVDKAAVKLPDPVGRERVLFVDDEPTICMVIRRRLEQFGYDVSAYHSPTDALDAFKAEPDVYDIVVTDLTMPGLTGIQLARAIHRDHPDTPIILCSGFIQSTHESESEAAGIVEFVHKPADINELGWSIRRALDGASTG